MASNNNKPKIKTELKNEQRSGTNSLIGIWNNPKHESDRKKNPKEQSKRKPAAT